VFEFECRQNIAGLTTLIYSPKGLKDDCFLIKRLPLMVYSLPALSIREQGHSGYELRYLLIFVKISA